MSQDDKPVKPESLFGGLFGASFSDWASAEYRQALQRAQAEFQRWQEEEAVGTESHNEPKGWIN